MGSQTKDITGLQIRCPTEEDIIHLVVIENECFGSSYYKEYKFGEFDFMNYLRDKHSIFYVALQSFSLVGYVVGQVVRHRSHKLAHIDSIAVTRPFRNREISNLLLSHLNAETKRRKCQAVVLKVAEPNKNAVQFFSKHGFKVLHHLPAYYSKGVNGIRTS